MKLEFNTVCRQLALYALLGLAPAAALAQSSDFDKVVLPATAKPSTLGDFLVQQAWVNAPNRRELEAAVARTDADISLIERSWLEQINANINFASQRQEIMFVGEMFLAPGFNLGASVNLGGIVNTKRRVKVAQVDREIALAQLDGPKPELRLAVLNALQEVENSRELLKIRRRAEVDAETNYTLVRSLYDQGKAQFEDVAQASDSYFRAVENTAVAKSNQLLAQIELESLTGLNAAAIEQARQKYASN